MKPWTGKSIEEIRRLTKVATDVTIDCGKCGKGVARYGPCPYAEKIHDDESACEKDCCRECRGLCRDEI